MSRRRSPARAPVVDPEPENHMNTHGRDIRSGAVLTLRTGKVRVVEAYLAHGGVEVLAVPMRRKKGAGGQTGRILWFWLSQPVPVEIANSGRQDRLRERPARPVSGAAARKRVA